MGSGLETVARDARRLVIETVHGAGAGHVGGPLSAIEILVSLYHATMRIRPEEPRWPERDRFVLSKGHSCVALYAVMALRGYFPTAELRTFDQVDSRLQGHPDMQMLPGIDMSTGSLAQGFSSAVGMALGARLSGAAFHTWVLLGDGECQEGQVWEAAQTAARYGLGNLTAIVDANGLQQYGWQEMGEASSPAPDLPAKWRAFGWHVEQVPGHDFPRLLNALARPAGSPERPKVVIAETVKGKGVSFMEGRREWHARTVSDEELRDAVHEMAVADG
jgi:transketolase